MSIEPNKKIAIFGSAGSAFETADIAFAAGFDRVVLIAHNQGEQEKAISKGLPAVLESEVNQLRQENYQFALGIADSRIREEIVNRYKDLMLDFPNLIHPTVVFGYGQTELFAQSRGNVLAAGVVLSNHISFGDFDLINRNATIGHDCDIGDYVSLMPGVVVSGNVALGKHCMVGAGATILQGQDETKLCIGTSAIVGASALVNKAVNNGITVVGVPAQPIKVKGNN